MTIKETLERLMYDWIFIPKEKFKYHCHVLLNSIITSRRMVHGAMIYECDTCANVKKTPPPKKFLEFMQKITEATIHNCDNDCADGYGCAVCTKYKAIPRPQRRVLKHKEQGNETGSN